MGHLIQCNHNPFPASVEEWLHASRVPTCTSTLRPISRYSREDLAVGQKVLLGQICFRFVKNNLLFFTNSKVTIILRTYFNSSLPRERISYYTLLPYHKPSTIIYLFLNFFVYILTSSKKVCVITGRETIQ